MAAVAQTDSLLGVSTAQAQDNHSIMSQSRVPSSTQEQYNQLMLLLNQQSSNQERVNKDIRAAGFLAGKKFCFLTFIDNNA